MLYGVSKQYSLLKIRKEMFGVVEVWSVSRFTAA
jgi:hypothetical protein